MKNQKALIILSTILSIGRIFIRGKFALGAFVILLALTFWTGCNSTNTTGSAPSEDEIKTGNVHIAFAGGGWRAHTGHAGWTMSLLDNGNKNLNEIFSNVGAVSSNSGGSWFSTMLMYSNSFVTAIEGPDAISTWHSTGWLGQQKALFDAADCHLFSGDIFLGCIFDKYSGSLANASRWDLVVKDLIFKDYPINETMIGTRQPWGVTKPLLLAATMLTNQVVLNGSTLGNKQYYEACLNPSVPVLNGDNGASCNIGATPDVTPVTFSNIPVGSPFTAPPFLPAARAGSASSHFNLGYTQTKKHKPAVAQAKIQNPLSNDLVPVVLAAAASSAAAGFEASKAVSGSDYWVDSYEDDDEALSFQLDNSMVQFSDASNLSVETLAKKKFVRIADGGPTDNSGVAQLVSFLQLNNQADGFNIVAFDNVQEIHSPGGNAADVGIDIAYLFGKGLTGGNKFCSGLKGTGTCVTVPNLQIFDSNSLNTTEVTWSVKDASTQYTHKLIYTKYTVTTKENLTFGISAGKTGTLHAFNCVWSDADTAPQDNTVDGDFTAYTQMLSFINSGLLESDAKGLKHLEEALGISH